MYASGFLIFQTDFQLLLFKIVENSAKSRERTDTRLKMSFKGLVTQEGSEK